MAIFSFIRLIEKYSIECQIIRTSEGKWQAGEWQAGETVTENVNGALIPFTERRIQNSGGSYKQGDCEFVTLQQIELTDETFLVYKNKKYKLEDATDYFQYADFKIYVARGVSAFDTTGSDTKDNP